ncbi:MAG: 50S ribosomal protein L21 [Oligoflexia bacterium]|nr:50S ribosomal protein L21 [Oligoflexia bacterium]
MIPYAVVKTGGRQYRVSPGDSLSVEKLNGNPGDEIEVKDVLMVGGEKLLIGQPVISGAKVSFVIERQYRGDKILVFKKKRRNKYRRMKGHRSELTRLFVSEISSPVGTFKAETKPNVITAEVKAEKKEALKTKTQSAAPKKAATKKKTSGAKKKTGAKKAVKKAKR